MEGSPFLWNTSHYIPEHSLIFPIITLCAFLLPSCNGNTGCGRTFTNASKCLDSNYAYVASEKEEGYVHPIA